MTQEQELRKELQRLQVEKRNEFRQAAIEQRLKRLEQEKRERGESRKLGEAQAISYYERTGRHHPVLGYLTEGRNIFEMKAKNRWFKGASRQRILV